MDNKALVETTSDTKPQEHWWGVKKMSLDEFNDLMADLHWSRYTQVKIEVVQADPANLKNEK